MPVVGFLNSAAAGPLAPLTRAFIDGLRDGGFVDGRNATIEYRWAEGRADRLPALGGRLIDRKPGVIVANANAALVAGEATTTIPIVFLSGTDPVRAGLVNSLNRPEGNVTGVAFFTGQTGTKRMELLQQLVPHDGKIGVLLDAQSIRSRRSIARCRDRRARSALTQSRSQMLRVRMTSIAPLSKLPRRADARFSSATAHSSPASGKRSSLSRQAMRCPRVTRSANIHRGRRTR